ncbi:hypothetical protein [Peribacillus sp. NPDC060253]|uniref:hypothetical protein n=1 Tax=Peribacillus sp. NPDC060253 TaxID=3347084 RepID=UPI003657EB90
MTKGIPSFAKAPHTWLRSMPLKFACIDQFFPENISYSKPEGGLFIWVELLASVDPSKIFVECLKNNVAIVPGIPFFPNGTQKNTLRQNYSNTTKEQIREGIKRIG